MGQGDGLAARARGRRRFATSVAGPRSDRTLELVDDGGDRWHLVIGGQIGVEVDPPSGDRARAARAGLALRALAAPATRPGRRGVSRASTAQSRFAGPATCACARPLHACRHHAPHRALGARRLPASERPRPRARARDSRPRARLVPRALDLLAEARAVRPDEASRRPAIHPSPRRPGGRVKRKRLTQDVSRLEAHGLRITPSPCLPFILTTTGRSNRRWRT